MTWLNDIFRSIFFFIDRVVYFFVDKVYSLFLEIANTTIFTDGMIEAFAGKVYALVGIFMLFKVSFSILTYIVNPDEFTDKNKGMGKLVTNIVTSLVLLLAVPFIFKEAMDIQRIILKDDIIPKIFSTQEVNISSQDPGQGSEMALITFTTFYEASGYNSLGEVFSTDVNEKNASGDYIVEYTYIISTVVGVVLVLLLISFCFDIALRSIKLGFLRMMAPIPIIARVDPKKGNELFSKWTKTCISTYLDLFMRLAAIFFAIYIIKAVQISISEGGIFADAVTGDTYTPSGLVMVFIILGALMFAKQLPKLIEDLLGVKLSGNFSLNPLKKLEDVPLAGKPLASATRFAGRTGATVGGLLGAGAVSIGSLTGKKIDNLTGNRISSAADSFNAWRASAGNSLRNGTTGFLANHETLQSAVNRVGRDFRSIGNDAQSTLYGAIGGIPGTSGVLSSAANKFDKQIKEYDTIISDIDSMMKRANSEMIKYNDIAFKDNAGNDVTMKDFKNAKEYLAALRNRDTSRMSETELQAHVNEINELQTNVSITEKLAEQAYIDAVRTGSLKDARGEVVIDAEVTTTYDNVVRTVSSSSDATVRAINTSSANGMKKGKDSVTSQKATVKNSAEYKAAQARKNAVPNKK